MRSLTVSPMAAASRRYPSAFLAKWALYVFDPATCQYLKHRQLCRQSNLGPIWDSSYSNKLGRLCQGVSKGPTSTGQLVKGTDTFCVIHFSDIPCDRLKVITVTKVVCDFFFEKENSNRTRITIMGNQVVYAGDAGTKTASLDI